MEIYIIFSLFVIAVTIIVCAVSNARTDSNIEKQFKDIENSNSELAITNRQLVNRLSDAKTTVVRIDDRIKRSSKGIERATEAVDSLTDRIRELERTSRTSEELIAECEKIIEEAEKEK